MKNEVNIYIYTTVKGPRKRCGAYTYVLEVDTSKGPATLSDTKILEEVTEHQASLIALAAALKRLYKHCNLKIYMDSVYVVSCTEKWLDTWKKNEWKNAKGQQVANVEEWKGLACLLNEHKYQFITGRKHSFYEWIQTESEKAEKKCMQ